MEEIMVSVEELDFSIRDNQATTSQLSRDNEKQFLKGEISVPRSFDSNATLSNTKQRLLLQKEHEKQPQKHYSLPLINVQKDRRSNSLVCGEVNSLCNDNNNFEFDNKHTSNLSDQFQTGVVRNGKRVLAPIQPLKKLNGNSRQRANTNPEVVISKLKDCKQEEGHQTQPNFTGKQEQHKVETRSAEQLGNGCSVNAIFLDSDDGEFLGVPTQTRRRFSAPLSPRFVRRLVPEIFYSKTNNNKNSYHETSATETRPKTAERRSIFSPPSKEFDQITTQDEGPKPKEHFNSQSKSAKSPRKALDVTDFRANTTRFLSEIKVSLPDKTQGDSHRRSRVKTEKRKNSYAALSASSEELFTGDILPPVKTNMPEVAPPCSGRNRASSMSLLRHEMSPKTFDSPMFLDVGSQRHSHLSLSPRLPRKF